MSILDEALANLLDESGATLLDEGTAAVPAGFTSAPGLAVPGLSTPGSPGPAPPVPVSSPDFASAADSDEVNLVRALVPGADSVTGTDVPFLLFARADTGHGTDTASPAHAAVLKGDTGHGLDAGLVHAVLSGADTAHGLDAGSVHATAGGADAGHGTEAGSVRAALLKADAGHGTEAALGFGADSAHAAEAGSAAAVGTPHSADTGHGTEAGSAHAALPGADTGHGADAGSVRAAVSKADAGHGTEAGAVAGTTTPHSADAVKATESAFYYVPGADAGHALDAASVAVRGRDAAAGSEQPLRSWPSSADLAGGAGRAWWSGPLAVQADTGHGADAVKPFSFSSADTAHMADAQHVMGIWTYSAAGVRLGAVLAPAPYRHDPAHAARLHEAVRRLEEAGSWVRVRRLVRSADAVSCSERALDGRR